MKIDRFADSNVVKLYQGNLAKDARTPGGDEGTKAADHAVISQKARDLQSVMSALKALPQTRTDVVTRLQTLVSSGTFTVNPDKVVKGMWQEQQLLKEAGMK